MSITPSMTTVPTANTVEKLKSVRFTPHLEVREYKVTLGDNPSVQAGPPITLDWKPSNVYKLDMEAYEAALAADNDGKGIANTKRSPMEMRVPASIREKWLAHNHSQKDITIARREASKVRSQRKFTAAALEMESFETALQSVGRKMKRLWSKKKSSGAQSTDPAVAWLEEYKKTAKPFPKSRPSRPQRPPPNRRSTFGGDQVQPDMEAAAKVLKKRSASDIDLASGNDLTSLEAKDP